MVPENSHLRDSAAKIITGALTSGNLRHTNRPNVPLVFPGLDSTGHNPQVTDAINQTAHMLGEALIDTVLNGLGAELIAATELEQLRAQADNVVPALVTLQCDHGELMKVAVKPGTNVARIACRRLRANLTECEEKT